MLGSLGVADQRPVDVLERRRAVVGETLVGLLQRDIELVAPEIDHVNETLATPVPMTDMHYADMTEPEGYLDNEADT